MPSDQERKDLIQGLLDNGVPVDKLKAAVGSLKSPEQQELFFQTAAQKLGRTYGAQPEPEGYRPPSGAEFTPDSALTPGKQLIKDAANALPSSLALAGGLVGGTATGAATLGMGAPAGAVTLAAAGGALGTSLKNAIMSLVQPEEAPQNPVQAMASATQGAVEGATQEMGGRVLGAATSGVVKSLASGAKSLAQKASFKSLPNSAKIAERLGSPQAIAETAQMIDDYAITSTPRTANMVADKVTKMVKTVGKDLEAAYKVVDDTAAIKYQPKSVASLVGDRVEQLVTDSGQALSANDKKKIARTFLGYFGDAETISHAKLSKVARTIEANLYDVATPKAQRTLSAKLGLAIRQVNGELAEVAAGDAAGEVRKISKAYGQLATVQSQVLKAVRGNSLGDAVVEGGKAAVAYAAGGLPLATAVKVGGTTAAKTTGATAMKYVSKLSAMADQLGPQGRQFLKLVSTSGVDKALKYHAYELTNNKKYRETFFSLGGVNIDESGEQGGQQ